MCYYPQAVRRFFLYIFFSLFLVHPFSVSNAQDEGSQDQKPSSSASIGENCEHRFATLEEFQTHLFNRLVYAEQHLTDSKLGSAVNAHERYLYNIKIVKFLEIISSAGDSESGSIQSLIDVEFEIEDIINEIVAIFDLQERRRTGQDESTEDQEAPHYTKVSDFFNGSTFGATLLEKIKEGVDCFWGQMYLVTNSFIIKNIDGTEETNLTKGSTIYFDSAHGNHFEIYDPQGKNHRVMDTNGRYLPKKGKKGRNLSDKCK